MKIFKYASYVLLAFAPLGAMAQEGMASRGVKGGVRPLVEFRWGIWSFTRA